MIKISALIYQAKSVFLGQGIQGISDILNNQGRGILPTYINSRVPDIWINGGVPCTILKPGKDWRKGKLRFRISLEFCPDESEPEDNPESASGDSSLDIIRRS